MLINEKISLRSIFEDIKTDSESISIDGFKSLLPTLSENEFEFLIINLGIEEELNYDDIFNFLNY